MMPRGCTIWVVALAAALGGCASNPSLQKVSDRTGVLLDKTAPVTNRVTVGLPNVQWPEGATHNEDLPTQDVVANGPESCGRYQENGVLRGQWPPCDAPTPVLAGPQLLPTSASAEAVRENAPWAGKEAYVFPWPAGRDAIIPERPEQP